MSGEQVGATDGRTQFSKPAVGDEFIYVGGLGEELRCYPKGETDPDPEWTFTREGSLSDSSPVLDEQRNQIYIGSGGGNLSAVDASTGEQNWVVETDSAITSTPRLASGSVYVGTNDGRLLKVDAESGNKRKEVQLDAAIYGQPLAHKRRVYALTESGALHARSEQSFDEDWRLETGGTGVRSSPIAIGNHVCIATDAVYKLKFGSGDTMFKAEYGGHAGSTPTYDGRIYVGDAAGQVHAFEPDNGNTRWTYDAGAPVTTTPVEDSGRVLVGDADGRLHSISATDQTDVSTQNLSGRRPSMPVVVDGDFYIARDSDDGGAVVRMDRQTLAFEPFPTISSVEDTGETDNGDPVYEVHGSNFGSKDQGPAVLYDDVSEAHENGDLNTFHGEFYDNEQDLYTAYPELNRVYDTMSIPEEKQDEFGVDKQDKPPAQYISAESEQPHRHDGVDAHYRMRNGSYIGLPMAYGGNHESTDPDMERRYERPDNKKQLYLAWWMRPTFDPWDHVVLETTSTTGEFDFGDSKRDRGERIVVPGGGPGGEDVEGWLIGVRDGGGSSENDDGRIEVEFDPRSNTNLLVGKTIEGQDSGATAQITDNEDKIGKFLTPNKLCRVWESGGATIGFALTPNSVKLNDGTNKINLGREGCPNARQWNLQELVFDIEEGWIEYRHNFESRGRIEWDPTETETNESPTLQLLGMHTSTFGFNTFRYSEIYQDSTVQRVVVADAETLEEASHYELQRPTQWSDGSLRFALNDGQLPTDQQLYVFVFDDQGQANQQGYPISLSTGDDPVVEQPLEPAVDENSVYVAGRGQMVQSFARRSGLDDPEWTFTREGSGSPSRPALDDERGQLYVGGGTGTLYAIDTETGEENWVVETDSAITSTPMMKRGKVFVGTNDGRLLRVDAESGTNEDSTQLDGAIYGRPVYFEEESWYMTVVTAVGTVYRIIWWNLKTDWKQETGGEDVRTSAVLHQKGVFVATDKLYKLNKNLGDIMWERSYDGTTAAQLLFDGHLIVGDDEGTVTGFSRIDPSARWTYDAGSPVTSVSVHDGGRILVTSEDGTIHSIDIGNESNATTVELAGSQPSSPVVAGRDIYVGTDDGETLTRLSRDALDLVSIPSIDAAESTGETDNGDPVYEVRGSDFGTKDQGPAVLYDFVSEAYENGTRNPFHGEFFEDGQILPTAYPELDRVYDNMSLSKENWDLHEGAHGLQDKEPAVYVSDESEQPNRHDDVDAHYRMRDGAYIGFPMAYGGNHESTDSELERRYERPEGNKQLYFSWWMRPTFDIKEHIAVEVESVDGEFEFGGKRERGERIRVPDAAPSGWDTDDLTGWIIGVRDGEGSSDNDDGLFEVEFDRRFLTKLGGSTIIGEESGTTAEIPNDADIVTYTKDDKLCRVSANPASPLGFAHQPTYFKLRDVTFYLEDDATPNPKQWNLIEFIFDIEEGWVEYRHNFESRGRVEFDPTETQTPDSPTLELIGQHTSQYGYNTFRISEVYQDSTVQRVVVADAETLEAATHYEIQRPREWADGSLRFALTDGQLPADEQLYVFVFDDQNQANLQGHPISLSTGGN